MTGHELTRLLRDGAIERALLHIAKRYSRNLETREEYAQEGLLRIAHMEPDLDLAEYIEGGSDGMWAAYMRHRRRVYAERRDNVNSSNRTVPPDAVHLYRDKWLRTIPDIDYGWYYPGEWLDYGLTETDAKRMNFYEIIVIN